MDKINSFNEWMIAIMEVLDIDKNFQLVDTILDNKKYEISMKKFINSATKIDGWHQVIMTTGDYICANNLFNTDNKLQPDNIVKTRSLIIEYLKDFTINAIKAGYDFS